MENSFNEPVAEQAVIGGLLVDNDYFDLISDRLKASHFFNPVHGFIYSAISDGLMNGTSVDPIYLNHKLSQVEDLNAGSADYIALLLQSFAGNEASIKGYADIVIDMSKRREFAKLSEQASVDLLDNDKSASDLILDFVADADGLLLADDNGLTKSQSSEELGKSYIDALNADKEQASCYSGFIDLDNKLGGFVAGRVYVLAGRPSMGKSAGALNIARNVGMQNKGVVFLSLEMTNEGQSERMVASVGAKTFGPYGFPVYSEIRNEWRKGNRSKIESAAKAFCDMPIEWEEGVGLSLNNIRMVTNRAIRSLRARGNNLDLLIIDHIGHVSGSRKGQSNYEKVTEVSNQLIAIAKQYNVPVLALCQLSRAVEQRDDKRPQLSDLRESGHIEQDAAVVIGMYRDFYYAEREARAAKGKEDGDLMKRLMDGQNELEFLVLKNRHGNIGEVKLFCELSRMFIDNAVQDYREQAA